MATNEALGALSGVAWWATERALLSIGLYITVGRDLGNVRASGFLRSLACLEESAPIAMDDVFMPVLVDPDNDGVELAA